jgi:hypothetical protein
MAVIWDQSKMVQMLLALEEGHDVEYEDEPDIAKAGVETRVLEELLIRAMLEKYGKTCSYWERILRASIDRKFIDTVENTNFDPQANRNPKLGEVRGSKTSRRLLRVSDDKGTEIQNGVYRWCKYYFGEFRPIEQIGIQVLVALFTTLITVFIIL